MSLRVKFCRNLVSRSVFSRNLLVFDTPCLRHGTLTDVNFLSIIQVKYYSLKHPHSLKPDSNTKVLDVLSFIKVFLQGL